MAHAVDLVVYGGVLFYISVRGGDVRLGLVVIVVAYEVAHGGVGEELLEFRRQLRRQGLVVGDHQGGALQALDDVCHGEGLAGARNAQQHLVLHAAFDAPHQFLYGLGLVAPGKEAAFETEHYFPPPSLRLRAIK